MQFKNQEKSVSKGSRVFKKRSKKVIYFISISRLITLQNKILGYEQKFLLQILELLFSLLISTLSFIHTACMSYTSAISFCVFSS